jgi:hypothetical protein
MSQFTEGPWVAYDDNETLPRGSAEVATVASVGGWIVGVPTPGFPGGNYRDIESGTEEADARLIAAAPELYEALKTLLELDIVSCSTNHLRAVFKQAIDVIAKVET